MKNGYTLALVACLAAPLGCTTKYRYVANSATNVSAAKPAGCDFPLTATTPSSGFQEIGVLEPDGLTTDQLGIFKELIRKDVCAAGGDLVVGEINRGHYVRGIVFRAASTK